MRKYNYLMYKKFDEEKNHNNTNKWLMVTDLLTYIRMRSLTNVWLVVERSHSMSRAILIYMSYVKNVAHGSIMIKSVFVKHDLLRLNFK